MEELVIKKHDFEVAKENLKKFSQKESKDIAISSVRTSGWFLGLGNHKVTGSELNDRLSVVQQHLIDLNETNNRTIKEFGQIYSALDALDKEYLQAILISINATKETSKQIKDAQEKINEIVNDQKKTLEVLKKFKKKVDSYNHLKDIDKIWDEHQTWCDETAALSASVSNAVSLSVSNSKKIEEVDTAQQNNKEAFDSAIKELSEKNDNIARVLAKKIKYAWLVAGGSLGIALIELIIILLKVM